MDVRCLKGIDSLARLLETDERDTPGMILVGSATCPLSLDLQKAIRADPLRYPQFVFYEFDIDDYSAPADDLEVIRLLDDIHVDDLPVQILLPSSGCRPSLSKAVSLAGIRKALYRLY